MIDSTLPVLLAVIVALLAVTAAQQKKYGISPAWLAIKYAIAFEQFARGMVMHIAKGMGIPWSIVTDSQNCNYSQAREFYRSGFYPISREDLQFWDDVIADLGGEGG